MRGLERLSPDTTVISVDKDKTEGKDRMKKKGKP